MSAVGVPLQSVLVTGAAGFIASHLCAALVRRGIAVTALDVPAADWWRHAALGISCARSAVDLTDGAQVAQLLARQSFSHVLHLASVTDVTRAPHLIEQMLQQHVMATAHLLAAAGGRVGRILVTGTCEEYGNGAVPFDETQREVAVSPYSWSKICCTHLCELHARIFATPVVVLRPFLTYGPLQTSAMLIPAAIRAALTGADFPMTAGAQTREFNFVADIVDGLLRAAEAPGIDGQVINLAGGREVRIAEVVQMIYRLCASSGRPRLGALAYRPGETMHFYGAAARAHTLLGWQARTPLETGLATTIAWYRDFLARQEARA